VNGAWLDHIILPLDLTRRVVKMLKATPKPRQMAHPTPTDKGAWPSKKDTVFSAPIASAMIDGNGELAGPQRIYTQLNTK